MKTKTLILSIVAVASLALGVDTLDQAGQKMVAGSRKPAPNLPPASQFSHALIDNGNSILLSAWGGSLIMPSRTPFNPNKYTKLTNVEPTAARTITFPNSSGTVLLTAIDQWVFEGATADAYELTVDVVDPTADATIWLPNVGGTADADANCSFVVSTINSGANGPGEAAAVWTGSSSIIFEGATANGFETTLDAADATADVTYRLPVAAAGTYAVMSSTLATNAPDIANSVTGASAALMFEGSTADAFEHSLTATDPTADQTSTLPNSTGTLMQAQASTTTALTADDQAVTPGVNRILQLTSDDGTATNRTFTLSATGAITGMTYILIGPASNQCEIADTGIQKLSATWTPGPTDTLTLLFDGTNFIELGRSDN